MSILVFVVGLVVGFLAGVALTVAGLTVTSQRPSELRLPPLNRRAKR